jgi:hypothetical protein
MGKHLPPKIKKLSASKQRRLDQLLTKNAEGTIRELEKAKLKALVEEAEQLMMVNASELAKFSRSQSLQAPISAVPVTVWVNPETAER